MYMYFFMHVLNLRPLKLPHNCKPFLFLSRYFPHLTKHVTVEDLEHFIESKFAETLHGVTNEGGSPTLGQSTGSVLSQGDFETVQNVFVFPRVNLQSTKYLI